MQLAAALPFLFSAEKLQKKKHWHLMEPIWRMDLICYSFTARTQQAYRGISVTGYDPSLHVDVVKSDLTNRFSSCGKITDVFVLKSRALIYLFGIGAVDMALRLCRRGDSVLRAKALPNPKRKINHYRA
ncbi:hypothetical protein HID58_013797 [Brassica napus]|uniref:Uncharacterized protein n=1 Tax=Brassica napus TaxID=3708 RepID=A0ABQ7XHH1_BRANA|nr:hypothetical protein HID58_013790 [Brassica napus]KAH0855310.1 hypothetical protein HID58_013797 [Brassica napus]